LSEITSAMDVTDDNFFYVLPEVENKLKECLFVSIDGEFTALLSDDEYANR